MTRSLDTRIGTWLLAVVALLPSTGCSMIGLGVGALAGADTPRYDEVIRLDAEQQLPAPGTKLRVTVVGDGELAGRYVGLRDGALVLSNRVAERPAPTERVLPMASVREVRAENGTYWARGAGLGFVLGLCIDAVVVGVVLSNFHPR
jgi:hypothetical protein